MTRICVGAIAGAFGVRGEVRLKSFCAEPAAIDSYGPLSDESGAQSFTLRIIRPIKAGFAARIDGVADKDAADALRGTALYLDRDRLPDLPDDEYYHSDLIGLEVLDTGGSHLGRIRAILDNGATDLLEIHGPGLKNGVLVPFTRVIVPTIDLSAGKVIADPPPGIFPDD